MGENRSRDQKFFNCKEEHEMDYVARQYPRYQEQVKEFLREKCHDGTIKYSSHTEVYGMIEEYLASHFK